MVATRDQAIHVSELATKLGASANISSIPLYGRVDRHMQLHELNEGRKIVVATPGRLIDFLKVGEIDLSHCGYVVIDDGKFSSFFPIKFLFLISFVLPISLSYSLIFFTAEMLLTDSFRNVIHEIDTQIRPDRQLSLWTSDSEKLFNLLNTSNISKADDHPVEIILTASKETMLNANIKQNICSCSQTNRYKMLRKMLKICLASTDFDQKTLVFTNTQLVADDLAGYLRSAGIKAKSVKTSQELATCDPQESIDVFLTANSQNHQNKLNNIKNVIIYEYPDKKEELIRRMNHANEVFTIISSEEQDKKLELIEITGPIENKAQPADEI